MPRMDGIDSLLTTRQLQDLLQVDRITIYRMLSDGRLQGFKVGSQWRFSRHAIERWLQAQQASLAMTGSSAAAGELSPSADSLPLSCIQAIQGIFAEAMGVGTITTAADGTPLTTISNSCDFCRLILRTKAGQQRCENSWRTATTVASATAPQIAICHAGLNYVWGPISVKGVRVAATHAGQFLLKPPGDDDWSERIADLSAVTGVQADELRHALASVPVLDSTRQEQVPHLLLRVVETFSEIGEERQSLLERLQRIAEMTQY